MKQKSYKSKKRHLVQPAALLILWGSKFFSWFILWKLLFLVGWRWTCIGPKHVPWIFVIYLLNSSLHLDLCTLLRSLILCLWLVSIFQAMKEGIISNVEYNRQLTFLKRIKVPSSKAVIKNQEVSSDNLSASIFSKPIPNRESFRPCPLIVSNE